MTKKDYIAIAKVIDAMPTTVHDANTKLSKPQLILALADMFKQDNASFDRYRFTGACYKSQDSAETLERGNDD